MCILLEYPTTENYPEYQHQVPTLAIDGIALDEQPLNINAVQIGDLLAWFIRESD